MKSKIDLNGTWNFKTEKIASKIKVPSNWYLQGYDIFGEADYKRAFNLKKSSLKHYFIVFDGVDYFAKVFINNKLAGNHEGYFQRFRMDITRLLKNGKNEIKVIVNSPKEAEEIWPDKKILIKGIFNHHDTRPGSWSKKYGQDKNTGGIWNNVYLIAVDAIEIERVKITPLLKDDGKWNVSHELIINNRSEKALKASIETLITPYNFKGASRKLKNDILLNPGLNTIELNTDFKNPVLWWTWDFGKQNLYKFTYNIKADRAKDNYTEISGIREFKRLEDKCWYLNGKRIFLRGTNIIPTQWLSEYTNAKIKKDAKLLKGANINIIRIHAHVNREELYFEMDRAGIMVWQDFALQWAYEETESFTRNASAQIKDMVNQHYNRPSITIWCCHNEPFVNLQQLDPVLVTKVREEDPVRYIEKASDFAQHFYPGWYVDATPLNFARDLLTAKKQLLCSEYGAQAIPCLESMKKMFATAEMYPPDLKKWMYHDFQPEQTFNQARIDMGNNINEFIENSQQYQADLLKDLTEAFRKARYEVVGGLLQFMFCECWPSIAWGVVDYFRIPKKGYYYLKTAFQPVYPGYSMPRKNKSKGESLSWGTLWDSFFVINDLPYSLKNIKARIKFTDADGKVYHDVQSIIKHIEADTISHPFQEKELRAFERDRFEIPLDSAAGKHTITLELYGKGNKKIARNYYEFIANEPFVDEKYR